VVKHRMTVETHNWSSSTHQELHKIVKDEIFPIVNQVDARVQNFEIQFLKEAAKFVGDFKSLAKEADESLAKYKALELEIERLLRAVVSQDIISVVQKTSVVDTSNLQTELEHTNERFENYTRNPLSQKLESKNVELEFQVLNYAIENAHLKATNKNLFDSISVSQTQTKTIIASLQNELQNTIYKNAKLRTQLFKKVSDQKDKTHDTSANTKFVKKSIMENLPKVGETHALSKPVTSNSVLTPKESKVVKNDKVIAPGMFRINPFKNSKEAKNVPNNVIQICLWCVDSGCSKHMTGNLKLLINFIWKFMGTVRFGNDHLAAILGFGQLCDSDLEVAFRRNACFVRNLEGVDLLKGDRSTNLYTINLHEIASASPIHLMARASFTKSWLWLQRKKQKSISSTKTSSKFKAEIASSSYGFVWTNENSQYKWKASTVIIIRTDNGTEFKNRALKDYFDSVDISHQMSSVRTPQQNRVVERRNRTLVEAARTMLIFSRAPLFLWAENDREYIEKLGANGDIDFFIGYSADSCAYRIFNRRRKKILETMNVSFDELSTMAFEQRSELDLLFEAMYDDYIGGQPSATARTVPPTQEPQVRQTSTASTSIADT
nr:hypothetical protein [Tanacetum cinerariifolium]